MTTLATIEQRIMDAKNYIDTLETLRCTHVEEKQRITKNFEFLD